MKDAGEGPIESHFYQNVFFQLSQVKDFFSTYSIQQTFLHFINMIIILMYSRFTSFLTLRNFKSAFLMKLA